MYSLLINLLLHHSIPVTFRICIKLVHFTWSSAFCQSVKHTHNSSSIAKVHPSIILSIPFAFLFPFLLLNPNRCAPRISSVFLSILLLHILATVFAVYAMRLIVQWLLHFVAFGFFTADLVASLKILGHFPLSYILLISCVSIL